MPESAAPALFLFDIDGTLLRGATAVHREAFAHAFREVYGLPLSLDGLNAAGRTDAWLFREALTRAGVPEERIHEGQRRAFQIMGAYVEAHLDDLGHCVLPGVHDLLALLHDQQRYIGLLTGNLEHIAYAKMRKAGLARYFDTGGFGEESPQRDALVPVARRSMEDKIGNTIPHDKVVVIGDTPLDVQAGKAHGALTVGVATGQFDEAELEETGADLVLPSFADVTAVEEALVTLVASTAPSER